MIKDHEHDMKDLERWKQLDDNMYKYYACFDRDCDYHELRYVEIV